MLYRVILTRNGSHKKTIKRYKTKDYAFDVYHELKEKSENVIFPKRYINYNRITPIKYHLYIVKDREEGDDDLYIRDEFGKIKQLKPLYGKYTILDYITYNIEETFWLFGCDKRKDRKTVHDITRLLVGDLTPKSKKIKNVITVHNKLLIYDEDQFDMVICKCKKDSQRLQQKLREATIDNKLHKNILFLGTASKKITSDLYEMIEYETGWPIEKIRRISTKP